MCVNLMLFILHRFERLELRHFKTIQTSFGFTVLGCFIVKSKVKVSSSLTVTKLITLKYKRNHAWLLDTVCLQSIAGLLIRHTRDK